jgi:hypothetical protein
MTGAVAVLLSSSPLAPALATTTEASGPAVQPLPERNREPGARAVRTAVKFTLRAPFP